MNVKTTIVLLLVLLVGAGYIIIYNTNLFTGKPATAPAPAGADTAAQTLFPKSDRVVQFTLANPGTPKVTLALRGEQWRLTEPVEAPAEDGPAHRIASALTGLRAVRTYQSDDPNAPRDSVTFLSKPRRVLSFTDDKGASYTLHVGNKVPMAQDNSLYVQLAGDQRVYVVNSDILGTFDKSVEDFRRQTVVDFGTAQPVAVQVQGNENYRLVKAGENWAFEQPLAARADNDKVKALVAAFTGLKAQRYVRDNVLPAELAGYGLAKPQLLVTVEAAPPAPPVTASAPASAPAPAAPRQVAAVAFGLAAEGKVFAALVDPKDPQRPATLFQVEQTALDGLAPKFADLRDKRVLDVDAAKVRTLTIQLPGGKTVLERADAGWKMTVPVAGAADGEAVSALLKTLSTAQATSRLDKPAALSAYGLEPPQGSITLALTGQDQPVVLQLGQTSGSGQTGFVQPQGSPSVAAISSNDMAVLLKPAPAYWDRTLVDLPAEAVITQVDITSPEGAWSLLQTRPDKFRLVAPVTAEADEVNAFALVAELRKIKADKIIALSAKLPERFAQLKPVKVQFQYTLPPPAASQPAFAPAIVPAEKPHWTYADGFWTLPGAASQPASQPTTQATTRPAFQAGDKVISINGSPVKTFDEMLLADATGKIEIERKGERLTIEVPASGPAPATRPAGQPALTQRGPVLLVAQDQGKTYLWIDGASPAVVGEFHLSYFEKFTAELRQRTVIKLEPEKIVSVKMQVDKQPLELSRSGENWRCLTDLAVKVDAAHVRKFLGDFTALKAKRFMDYSDKANQELAAKDKPTLERYALDKPALVFEFKDEAGAVITLSVSRTGPVGAPGRSEGFYAVCSATPGVFVLGGDEPKRMQTSLEDLKKPKPEVKEPPPGPPSGMSPMRIPGRMPSPVEPPLDE